MRARGDLRTTHSHQFLEWWTPNRKSDLLMQIDAIGCREPPASTGDTKSLSNLTSLR